MEMTKKIKDLRKKIFTWWESLGKQQTFILGLLLGVISGVGLVLLSNSFVNQSVVESSSVEAAKLPLTPRIFRVTPEKALVGEEIIIRGGRFISKGKVCFRSCDTEFEVIGWSSQSIKARVTNVSPGMGDLWLIDGEGNESSRISFEVE